MTTKLTLSCSIFWIVWVLSISYWVATVVFSKAYVVESKEFLEIEMLMFVVCMASAALSFVGCWFMFFDINHFVCVTCYGIPMALIIPGFCLYGIFKVQQLDDISDQYMERHIRNYWSTYGTSPRFLSETESHKACCGINSPFDYRKFLYGKNCSNILLDVPYSCCNLEYLLKNVPAGVTRKCKIFNKTLFGYSESDPSESELTAPKSCQLMKTTAEPHILPKYVQLIPENGCMQLLVNQAQELLSTHFVLFITFGVSSFMMLWITVKNGWDARHEGEGRGHDHVHDQIKMVKRLSNQDEEEEEDMEGANKRHKSLPLIQLEGLSLASHHGHHHDVQTPKSKSFSVSGKKHV